MKVEVKNLSKYYGDFCAVNDISFSFESGRIFSIIGRNGSGKTSTIRMMLGTIAKNGGSVTVDSKNFSDYLNRVGYLPEERGLYQKDTVEEQLLFFAQLKGVSKSDFKKYSDYWLERMELTKYRKSKLETLSKGNQQKVQIAASIIHDPDIVILDEPFSGLDPVNSSLLLEIVSELESKNKCIMISSHQLNLIENICDDLLIISNSKTMYYGSVDELKNRNEYNSIIVKTSSNILEYPEYKAKKLNSNLYSISSNENVMTMIRKMMKDGIDIEMIDKKQLSLHEIFVEMEG